MPKMKIERSVKIDAPVEKVYRTVNDFNHWTAWSPWLIMEPAAKVNISEDAKYYSWEGQRVGSGNMKIIHEKAYEQVDYDLTFLKPWKSTARVSFLMHGHGDHSHVTWTMDSGLPFFMFWMKKSMEAYVGMDYERGLMMLKDYVEDGEVHSGLEFRGIENFTGCSYIGIRTRCNSDSLSNNMSNDFKRLWKIVNGYAAGKAFSIYHKWDMVRDVIEYTAGIPVSTVPDNASGDMINGKIPSTPVHVIRHTGPYAHLGNAWSAQNNYQRSKAFKTNKKIDPFEVYQTSPDEVPANDLVTDIYFPCK